MSAVYLNTYKVTVEATVQAESEDEARGAVSNLLNNSTLANVTTVGLTSTTGGNTRVAGINKVDVKMEEENQQGKAKSGKQQKLQKLAEEEIKKMQENAPDKVLRNIPDEVVVVDPDTGSGVVVPTPNKAKLQEEQQKKLEKEQEEDINPQTGETNKESQKGAAQAPKANKER